MRRRLDKREPHAREQTHTNPRTQNASYYATLPLIHFRFLQGTFGDRLASFLFKHCDKTNRGKNEDAAFHGGVGGKIGVLHWFSKFLDQIPS